MPSAQQAVLEAAHVEDTKLLALPGIGSMVAKSIKKTAQQVVGFWLHHNGLTCLDELRRRLDAGQRASRCEIWQIVPLHFSASQKLRTPCSPNP